MSDPTNTPLGSPAAVPPRPASPLPPPPAPPVSAPVTAPPIEPPPPPAAASAPVASAPVASAERQAPTFEQVAGKYQQLGAAIADQIRRRVIGQDEVVHDVIVSLVCGGHVLLEGVPGLGKTELLKSLAESISATFSRIQFTPDLMPADVVGTEMINIDAAGQRDFRFREGPVFANLLLADEINRATPKTQSSLLEAMQERQVTVGGVTRPLPDPFMVMATQNPIELEGTYPLPEAQLDRFFVKVLVKSPSPEVLSAILKRTTGTHTETIEPVCGPAELRWLIGITRQVPIAQHLIDYSPHAPESVRRYVRAGASPRGGQAIILASKAHALFAGRPHVSGADIARSARAALRHRVLLGYEATADGVDPDRIIDEVVATTVEPGQQQRPLAG
ncbi:UNVERIFIED_CONTAM: hypothetical protein GTU68_001621 [Idotea baltica]|nr:hypothetical protein [Idotea baltica]